MWNRVKTWAKRTLVTLVVLLPAGTLAIFGGFEVSSQPQFCGSCHIMAPYYESWLTSTHHEVACVECHIPPGIRSEFRKKYEALSMVTSYFTGTYSTNPWAEVDDQSCLRSGCHTKRVLLGRELYEGVLFDHQPHLTEMRRGKQLRCTSCHSQIVQGSHISVTASTCFLCHFKNTAPNTHTARCTICHRVPDRVIHTAGLSFDHGDVSRFGMQCMDCHQGVVAGDGAAPRDRCITCHNEQSRLKRYGDTAFLHLKHVTEHKVECLHCHTEIRHEIPHREEALATACETCHSSASGHSAVRDLYRGIAGHGVAPRPAAMYLAGIRCEACHNQSAGAEKVANEVSCMACHGPTYLTIYRSWRVGLQARVEGLRHELQDAAASLEAADHAADPLSEARANLSLLDDARPIHNPQYALDLVTKSHSDIAAALEAAGKQSPTSVPWVQAPYDIECLGCHFGIELLEANAFGTVFPHQPHVVSAGLRCTICHGEMSAHGTLRLSEPDCGNCHTKILEPMAGVSSEQCLGCHTADIGEVSDKVKFPHEQHIALGFDCSFCHSGVEDAAHIDFATSGKALPKLGHDFCRTCHAGDVPAADGSMPDDADCTKCHIAF